MRDTITVQMTAQGAVSLPKQIRHPSQWQSGETFVLLEFEDEFILCPSAEQVSVFADYIERTFVAYDLPYDVVFEKTHQQPALSVIPLTAISNYLTEQTQIPSMTQQVLHEIVVTQAIAQRDETALRQVAASQNLTELVNEMNREATANGLTPEILESLLDE